MDLNRIDARLAPRTTWQAADFGTRLYRRWWRQTSLVWLVFTGLPFAAPSARCAFAWAKSPGIDRQYCDNERYHSRLWNEVYLLAVSCGSDAKPTNSTSA